MSTSIDVLKQLDDRIQASVTRIQQLRKENEQLQQKLAESERRLGEAGAQIKQFEQERKQHETRLAPEELVKRLVVGRSTKREA